MKPSKVDEILFEMKVDKDSLTDAQMEVINGTIDHRAKITALWSQFYHALGQSISQHDQSKMEEPELSTFAEWGPKLRDMEYGSDEYKEALANMGKGLDHHYEVNRHHPNFFENGIEDMNLLDIVEMFLDWIAAASRMKDGGSRQSFERSISVNASRFKVEPQLCKILMNTYRWMEADRAAFSSPGGNEWKREEVNK